VIWLKRPANGTVRMAVPSHRFHWYNGKVSNGSFAATSRS
jgi:hypothetical protein